MRTVDAETAAGKHRFVWDGLSSTGSQLPDGIYSFAISAVDRDDRTVPAFAGTEGRVTGVEMADDGIHLNIGQLSVPASSVIAVRETEVNS